MESAGQTVRCSKCHRPLRSATSRALGIGPRCAAIEAALDGLDSRQHDKAREAIQDGAVIPASRPGIAMVVSEDGQSVHLASIDGHCSCPHGVRRVSATAKTCWHPGAARLAIAPRLNATASSFILAA